MTNAPGYFCTNDSASADVVKELSCSVYFPFDLPRSTAGAAAGAGLERAIGFGAAGVLAAMGAFGATTGVGLGASVGAGFGGATLARTLGGDESVCALDPFILGAPAS